MAAPGATVPAVSGVRFRVLIAVAVVALLAACSGGSGGSSKGGRPSTNAQLEIVAPTPSQVTGPDVTVKLNLIGAKLLPLAQVGGPLRGDEGHIHVSVDDQTVQMTDTLSLPLANLAPGTHRLQAQFVAVDHLPFSNSPTAVVVFTVSPSGS
jgi:hypothetical protein